MSHQPLDLSTHHALYAKSANNEGKLDLWGYENEEENNTLGLDPNFARHPFEGALVDRSVICVGIWRSHVEN